jgi:hypothetical protein
MRFSEAPLHESTPATAQREERKLLPPTPELHTAKDGGGVTSVGAESVVSKNTSDSTKRAEAAGLLESIGAEFSRLRRIGRSGAWGDLEDKVAKSGHVLIDSGMISFKDWTGVMIDIEQFRKAEGGTAELPGDALARWLSEGDPKPDKPSKKVRAAKGPSMIEGARAGAIS